MTKTKSHFLDKLEPEIKKAAKLARVRLEAETLVLISIAISLKRIADSLEIMENIVEKPC